MDCSRSHELGVRMARGAQACDVLKLIISKGMGLAASGIGIGFLVSLGVTRIISSLLFGVDPSDPVTFSLISLLLAGVTVIACYIPARRATKVDPMTAVRCE